MSLFNWAEETRRHLERLDQAVALSTRHVESLENLVRSVRDQSAAAEVASATQNARVEAMLAATQARLDEGLGGIHRKIEAVENDVTVTSAGVKSLGEGLDTFRTHLDDLAAMTKEIVVHEQKRALDDAKAIRWMKDTRRLSKETDERIEHIQRLIDGMQERLSGHLSVTELLPSLVSTMEKLQTRFSMELREWRKLKTPMGAAEDAQFLSVAEPLLADRRTMLGYDRLYVLWQAVKNAASLRQSVVEVGAFRGGSAFFLAAAFDAVTGLDGPEIHIVDTFEGHPDHKISDLDSEQQRGKFATTSYEDVQAYLSPFPRLTVYKGEATELVKTWPDRLYSLVHLDVDLHDPTIWCLEYFAARLVPGAIIVLDDYGAPSCPGVELAVEEFLATNPEFQTWNSQTEQMVLVKR